MDSTTPPDGGMDTRGFEPLTSASEAQHSVRTELCVRKPQVGSGRFELPSRASKARMIVHYTTTPKWVREDLNLRTPPRQGGVTTRLDHVPIESLWRDLNSRLSPYKGDVLGEPD